MDESYATWRPDSFNLARATTTWFVLLCKQYTLGEMRNVFRKLHRNQIAWHAAKSVTDHETIRSESRPSKTVLLSASWQSDWYLTTTKNLKIQVWEFCLCRFMIQYYNTTQHRHILCRPPPTLGGGVTGAKYSWTFRSGRWACKQKNQLSVKITSHFLWFLWLYCPLWLVSWTRVIFSTNQKWSELKLKTNRDLLAGDFPRLTPATCICFELW